MARIAHRQSVEQDPQREVLYAMEFRELRGQWRGVTAKRKTLLRYVRMVCRLYGIKRCSVRFRTIDSRGSYLNGVVTLDPVWGRNAITLAHELAHHVTEARFPDAKQDHGPRFVRVYGEVLHIMRLMPLDGFKIMCRKHGVKMARPAA